MNSMAKVAVVGSGLGALSAAALLAKQGFEILILEQNWLPGGCTSTYPRKHFLFESGATTLVGLDPGMPLDLLQQKLGIQFPAWKLEHPMQVVLPDGTLVHRHQSIEAWIQEAERVFGPTGQRKFWETAFRIAHWVWNASGRFLTFPPERINDFLPLIKNTQLHDVPFLQYAFISVKKFIHSCEITHPLFEPFINEQLIITAQNHASQVNMLFGATALCYTNFGNYYAPGGMITVVNTLLDYIIQKGGKINYREPVHSITKTKQGYEIQTNQNTYAADFVVSGIPLNNLAEITDHNTFPKKKKILAAHQLYSAFQVGIAAQLHQPPACLHLQLHTGVFKDTLGSSSLFVSFSHPYDEQRTQNNTYVISVSTHIHPANKEIKVSKEWLMQQVIQTLQAHHLLQADSIIYAHASLQKSWAKWTGRKFGFVGGYPQSLATPPWAMNAGRIDNHRFYGCGDSFYPGQGIPGVVLSGIIAAEKLMRDWKVYN